jgi:hypothetical protein
MKATLLESDSFPEQFNLVDCQIRGIKKEYRQMYIDDFINEIDEDEDIMDFSVCVTEDQVEDFDYVDYYYDWRFDEDNYYEELRQITNPDKHEGFLIVYYNANWQGSTGIRIEKNWRNILNFDYDVTIYHKATEEESRQFNVFKVHSHDVPMGGTYLVIGLTYEELEVVENKTWEEQSRIAEAYLNLYKKALEEQ